MNCPNKISYTVYLTDPENQWIPRRLAVDVAGALANLVGNGSIIIQFGARPTSEQAGFIAVLECAERWSQVRGAVVRDTAAALAPPKQGLDAEHHCRRPNFGLAPFDENVPLEWVEVLELGTGRSRLVPVTSGRAAHRRPMACIGRSRRSSLKRSSKRDPSRQWWALSN